VEKAHRGGVVRGIFVTGTDTGVGKTLVATLLVRGLVNRGFPAIHFKPVQSGFISVDNAEYPADLAFSWHVVGAKESLSSYCAMRSLYAFREPLAPDHAAEKENTRIDPSSIVTRTSELAKEHLLVVEGAGGVAVPLTKEYLMADLIADLDLPALIVTRAMLGTLNHTYLTVAFLRHRRVHIAGLVVSLFNEHSETDVRNLQLLPAMNDTPLLGVVPRLAKCDTERPSVFPLESVDTLLDGFDWENIISFIV